MYIRREWGGAWGVFGFMFQISYRDDATEVCELELETHLEALLKLPDKFNLWRSTRYASDQPCTYVQNLCIACTEKELS